MVRSNLTVRAVMLLSVCLVVASCAPGNPAAYDGLTSNCSSKFVSDFNQVETHLNDSVIGEFEQKYKDVACDAKLSSATSLDSIPTRIVVNERVSSWRSKLSARSVRTSSIPSPYMVPKTYDFQATKKPFECSSQFFTDYNEEMKALRSALSPYEGRTSMSYSETTSLRYSLWTSKARLERLKARYKGTICSGVQRLSYATDGKPAPVDEMFYFDIVIDEIIGKVEKALKSLDESTVPNTTQDHLIQNPTTPATPVDPLSI